MKQDCSATSRSHETLVGALGRGKMDHKVLFFCCLALLSGCCSLRLTAHGCRSPLFRFTATSSREAVASRLHATSDPTVNKRSSGDEIYDDQQDNSAEDRLPINMMAFKEYAKSGLNKFKNRDLKGAIDDLLSARVSGGRQPLSQLGIFLYCNGQYKEAESHLAQDIDNIENAKLGKASELRLWRSASLFKLGKKEEAVRALDHRDRQQPELKETKYGMICCLNFFAGETSLEEMLQLVDKMDGSDFSGMKFFCNFYVGLYHDSIGDADMSRVFLAMSKDANRYPDRDLWFHLPRVLYAQRFGSD